MAQSRPADTDSDADHHHQDGHYRPGFRRGGDTGEGPGWLPGLERKPQAPGPLCADGL